MKNIILLIGTYLLAISMGCKKNDDNTPMETALQNGPPLSFDLLNVPDDATDVNLNPTLSWESAKNPKGSEVTYDLYLDTDVNPTTLLESNIGGTSYEITERLKLLTDYNWKIVAKDADGKTSQSSIQKFTTRQITSTNEPLVASTEFSARSLHASVVFENKIWVIGGREGDLTRKNDVWYSSDGVNWSQATSNAQFTPRSSHAAIVFQNKIWVVGGYDGEMKNDIWQSVDGVNWIEVIADADFSPTGGHTLVVFNNRLWLIGGGGDLFTTNDIWYSENGINWTEATNSVPFEVRAYHTATVFNGKIWVIGGTSIGQYRDDIWYSGDGVQWTKGTAGPPFRERAFHSTMILDNKIWILSGYNTDDSDGSNPYHDVWQSADGLNWEKVDLMNVLTPRYQHSEVIFDNKIWLLGGRIENNHGTIEMSNDVWVLE